MTNWQPPTIPAPPAPEPPKQSWFARHKILTAILAVIALIVVGQAVTGGSDPAPATTASAPSAQPESRQADAPKADSPKVETPKAETPKAETPKAEAPAPEPPAEDRIGTAVRDGKFEFTVTKVQPGVAKVGDSFLEQKAQGQFVLVHVTVTNIGDEAQYFSDSEQKVKDVQGRQFSADTSAAIHIKGNDVFLNEINPGNTVKGVLVYDMPKGAKPASIELHDSPFSGGVTVRLA